MLAYDHSLSNILVELDQIWLQLFELISLALLREKVGEIMAGRSCSSSLLARKSRGTKGAPLS